MSHLSPSSRVPHSIPLFRTIPALSRIPRVELCELPSPVEEVTGLPGDRALWLKRDDLNAPVAAGNKARALEFLLADARGTVATMGGDGSTHVLATATHAMRMGLRTVAIRWPHEMNPVALETARAAAERCERIIRARTPVDALGIGWYLRLRHGTHWVPFGGSSPLGILGHVNAALELSEQVAVGMLPLPERVVVPMGTGGTAAGLLVGFTIAELPVEVVAVRCGPRIGSNRRRVVSLADSTRAFIMARGGVSLPAPDLSRLRVVHDAYGGAYGRPNPEAEQSARALAARAGIRLDSTYGAKAFHVALSLPEPSLYWVTTNCDLSPMQPGNS
jgi:1-aminocyclopropane-1-carboxylate deaminase/D-cysteine desulfhydrase-like pyridoxal-dependent ACC family enzyme